MISENDENIDEFSQLPEFTPNKQLSQESTQQSCQSSQSNEACNDFEEPPSKRTDKRLAICAQFIQVHRKQEWAHFTNYVDWLTEVIKVDVHATDWKLGKCSCSFFKKNYICSHLVGISIRLGLCEAPSTAQTVDVGKHRGVGRPTNVPEKSAWLEQPTNYVSQFTKISSSIATIATTATTSDTAVASVAPTASNSEINPPKLRGRPPGSKNKPKKINMDKIKQMSRKY